MGRGRRLCRVAILRVGFRVGFVAFLLVDLREGMSVGDRDVAATRRLSPRRHRSSSVFGTTSS